ncbi:hypothetical protein CHMI_01996 [Cellulomonas hominis]|nr:hypothetical protein CHMI_01996 [Cellulomonas hominis]
MLPIAYFLGPAFVAALAAVIAFSWRSDLIAAVSTLVVAGAGVAIRLVLSAGDVPYQVAVLALAALSLAILAACTRREWGALRQPELA